MSLGTVLVGAMVTFAMVRIGASMQGAFASLGPCPRAGLFWFHPMLLPALIFAPIFPPRDWLGHYNGRFSLYAKKGSTILSGLWVWRARPIFWVADAEALKAITSDRHTFTKDINAYTMVDIYGKSLVTTEGNEWRRHVAIAGPAFNESTTALAWEEAHRLVHEWFAEELDNKLDYGTGCHLNRAVTVDILSKMTQLTLHAISAAGFGIQSSWSTFSDSSHSTDEALPFHAALELTQANLPIRVLVPSCLFSLPAHIPWVSDKLISARHAFDSMKTHMAEIVGSVRLDLKANSGTSDIISPDEHAFTKKRADLLRRLVEANEACGESPETNRRTLTDDELFSNIFTFLLAGHETSAHTLSFTILLLAVYPEVQKKLRQESCRIWPMRDDARRSSYKKDFDKFEYTLAFFRETLRCFPTEPRLIKLVGKDAVISGQRFYPTSIRQSGSSFDEAQTNVQFELDKTMEERFTLSIPKGSAIVMDIWGLHMNPLVWGPDAHQFRPERFIDTDEYKWPRDGFLAFSSGARGCIGQRFALAESICVLANLVRRYEILPATDPRSFPSYEEFKRSMLGYSVGLTIGPVTKHVKFKRLE